MKEFFHALKNKRARREYIKSIIVGLCSTAIDFLSTALILYAECHDSYGGFFNVFTGATVDGFEPPISIYITATVVGAVLSVVFNYVMCVFFVYQYGNVGKNKKGFLKFSILALIGIAITTAGSLLCSHFFGLDGSKVWWIKIAIAIVVFVYNFFTRKHFVFNIALIRDDENTINL